MNDTEIDYTFKIILFGDSCVGKTRFIKTLDHSEYMDKTTIGIDIAFKTYNVNNKIIKTQIFDTASFERLRSIPRFYSKYSHAILVCYDITSHRTFESLDNWISFIQEVNNEAPFIIVGMKNDLNNREVSTEEVEEYARIKNMKHIEASALNEDSLNNVITFAIDTIMNSEFGKYEIQKQIQKKEEEKPNEAVSQINQVQNKKKGFFAKIKEWFTFKKTDDDDSNNLSYSW